MLAPFVVESKRSIYIFGRLKYRHKDFSVRNGMRFTFQFVEIKIDMWKKSAEENKKSE